MCTSCTTPIGPTAARSPPSTPSSRPTATPDWRLDPADRVLAPPTTRKGGDLARMLGVERQGDRARPGVALDTERKAEDLSGAPFSDYALETSDKPGPTILVVGELLHRWVTFAPMLSQHAQTVVWLHIGLAPSTGIGSTSFVPMSLVDADRARTLTASRARGRSISSTAARGCVSVRRQSWSPAPLPGSGGDNRLVPVAD